MNSHSSDQTPDDSKLSFKRVLSIGAFVGVVLFAGYLYINAQKNRLEADSALSQQTKENQQLQSQMANLELALSDLKTAKVYEQQEQAISKSHAMGILETGEVLRQDIHELGRTRNELAARIASLGASDEGRRIASDLDLVEQANDALNVTLPSESQPNTLLLRLDGLLSAPKQAIENQVSGYAPGQALLAALETLRLETADSRAIINRIHSDLNVIARKAAELPINAQRTFAESVAALEEIKEQQRSELIAQARDDAKLEGAKRIAEQEAENERKIAIARTEAAKLVGEQTAAKIVTEAQAEKQRQDAAKLEQEAATAKAKLEADFKNDLGEIRNYLTAFISDGYEYRGKNLGKGPASLAALQGAQLFQPGRTGLEAILKYAGNRNDRPRGPIGEYIGGDYGWQVADKDVLNKVQQLLIKYGHQMVEKGLLAP